MSLLKNFSGGQAGAKSYRRLLPGLTLAGLALMGVVHLAAQGANIAPIVQSAFSQQLTTQQPTVEEQRAATIIQQVEQAYANGEAAYRKGMLAQARSEFDRAIDLLLASGVDLNTDPRLGDEFNKTLDRINALEAEALRQGTGFTPKTEETPSDAAEEVTFQPDPALLAKAKAQLANTKSDLPLVINDYVAGFIRFFSETKKGHNTLLHSFQRAGRYRAMIERVLAEEGVPQDLIFLAVAESGFQPTAVNRKSKAGGMWQFMPRGNYGLEHNEWVDERFDPEKSTRAYGRYMKFIYAQLGDWYLSMAGYDWGTGNVQHAVAKTGYADFWELYRRNNLPGETKNYVPEILAAIIIAKNPKQYGFDDLSFDPPVLTDTVTLSYPLDLRLAADIVSAPVDELAVLNPSLLHYTTPPDGLFDLHLPAGTGSLFEQRIAAIPTPHRTAWRYHRIVAGETLASIAREYHLNESELLAANQISHESGEAADLRTGVAGPDALILPTAPTSAPSLKMTYYTPKHGDTLITIADRFGVSLDQLRRWNHLTGTKVTPGERIKVGVPTSISASAHHSSTTMHGKASTTNSKAGSTRSKASTTAHKTEPAGAKTVTKNKTTKKSK